MDPRMWVRRVTDYAGVAAVAVSAVAIVAAMALAPWFSLTGNALSDLGARSVRYSFVFNLGLVLSGLLGAVFVLRLAAESGGAVRRLGQVLLFGALSSLAGVGLFPTGDPSGLHGPVAIAFFLLLTYGLAVDGTASVLAGRRRAGLRSIWLALANVTGWVVYAGVAATSASAPGVALPELVGAVGLGIWAVSKKRRLGREETGDGESERVSPGGR